MSRSFVGQGYFAAKAALFFALILICASTATAQTAGTGAIAGTVMDSSGAVVRDVKITVTSVDTGQARTATTAVDGSFSVGLLPPGNYKIKMEATGFKGVEIPSVSVTVTETATVSRTLEVGNASQSVTVEEAVETVQTTSSTMGMVEDSRTITEIPLNTRNYTNLLTMTAGANSSVSNATTVGKGSPLIAVNGAGTSQNTYLQDGVVINNWYSFNTGTEGVAFGSFVLPIPDAIAEFKIQTSSYDAGYGRGPGASVNVVTKTGTNQFHGDGFEFFRNTDLNANDWFRNFKVLPRGTLNSNQYGGVIGGPIKKDKLFFFASYQETGQKNGLTGYGSATVQLPPIPGGNRGTCPTNATIITQCDAAGQAFIQNLAAATCPANHPSAISDTTTAGGLQVACPGSGTGDSFYNINPITISILQLKLPNGQFAVPGSGVSDATANGGYGVNSYSDPAIFKDHNLMGNGDYIINQKQTLAFRYQYEKDPLAAPFPVLNANLAGNFLPGNPTTTDKWNHAAAVKLTTILNATMVNEAHLAFQLNGVYDTTLSPFTNTQVGIKSLEPGKDNIEDFTIGSGQAGFNFGSQYQFDLTSRDTQWNWGDQLSWTKGKHTIRAGVEIEDVRFTTVYPGHAIGNPTFTRFSDFLIGRASCQTAASPSTCSATNPQGTDGVSATSNVSTIGTFTSGPATTTHWLWRAHEASAFLQDDFKVSQRLTINAGLRWEYDGLPYTDNGLFSGYVPSLQSTTALPQCPVVQGSSCTTSAGTLQGMAVPGNFSGTVPAGLGLTVYNNNGPTAGGSPWTDFAPRVGFAWQPTNNSKWVVRGGGGVFYDLVAGAAFLNYLLTSSPAVGAPQQTGPGISLNNLFIQSTPVSVGKGYGLPALWVNPATSQSSNLTISSTEPNLTVPTTYQWNLNTQYEFLPSWLVEVAYVGSHGIHQGAESASAQQGQISTFTGNNVAPLVGAGCNSCAIYGVTTNTVANVVLRVPQPGVSAANPVLGTDESYKFNGLEITIRKQMAHGLQLQASYTHSRSFITLPFGINEYPYIVHAYGPNNNYRPERFVLNYVWNIPTGHAAGALKRVIGDWALSGVTTIQSGSFMTITDTGGSIFLGGAGAPNSSTGAYSTAQLCPGVTYNQLLSSGSLDSRVTSGLTGGTGFFNGGSAVAGSGLCPTPTIGNGKGFGNMGIGALTGPGQFNFDASLSKLVHIGEKQSVQFRSEFFNIFNHPQFGNPGLGANTSTFGQITSTSVSPRVIQLALKYQF